MAVPAPTPTLTCDQRGFSSISDYVQCTDALRAINGGAPIKPPKPEEFFLLDIDFKDQTTQIALATLVVLLIHPLILVSKKWKSFVPDVPIVGMVVGTCLLVPNILALLYVATNVDLGYLKAHYEHLGHPPLYGDMPPLIPLLYGWLCSACLELVVIIVAKIDIRAQLVLSYLQVVDRYLCIFYWQNLTCLCRILTSLVTTIAQVLFCPEQGVLKMYVKSAYYVFNIIHMVIYIWRGKTNTATGPTEAATTSWFLIPNGYQQFAIFQLCMLVAEWILSFIIYRCQKTNKPITINVESTKQD